MTLSLYRGIDDRQTIEQPTPSAPRELGVWKHSLEVASLGAKRLSAVDFFRRVKGAFSPETSRRALSVYPSSLRIVVRRNVQLLSYLDVIRIAQLVAVGVKDTHEFAGVAIEFSADF
jgi:hypothetical protein